MSRDGSCCGRTTSRSIRPGVCRRGAWSERPVLAPRGRASTAAGLQVQRTEDALQDLARLTERILADRAFFLGDHEVQAVECLAGYVGLDIGIFRLDQSELGCLPSQLVVLLSELRVVRLLLDDRQEP